VQAIDNLTQITYTELGGIQKLKLCNIFKHL